MKWVPYSVRIAKFTSGRRRRLLDWHAYFAWYPVTIEEAKYEGILVPTHRVWLEYVDRKLNDDQWFRYRGWVRWFLMDPLCIFFPVIKWEYRPYTGASCAQPSPQRS